jgi:hypothetical protein
VVCNSYGYRLVVLAETVLFHLAIISIIGWLLLLIIPVPFTNFISSFSLAAFNDNELYESANVLVYTVILRGLSGNYGDWYSIIRNSGFAWEPGAFACYLCFGISFNILRTNFKLKNNSSLFVFLIALASTQSTTGYFIFLVILIVWLIYNRKFVWLVVLIPVFLIIMNLPFMEEKLMFKSSGFSQTSLSNAGIDETYDRITSIRIMWDEFLLNPILGYGFSVPEFEKLELHTWSGIGRLLAQYGIFMSIAFFVLLIKSSRKIGNYFSSSLGYILVISMVGCMISYNQIWYQPFCVAIWLFCLFVEPPRMAT